MNLIGYHGSKKDKIDSILLDKSITYTNFKIYKTTKGYEIPQRQKLPNDLGCGSYLFLDVEEYGFRGHNAALQFAMYGKKDPYSNEFSSKSSEFKVIKVPVSINTNTNGLNLNESKNKAIFNKVRNEFHDDLSRKLDNSIIKSGAKSRNNIDGVIIELLIKFYLNARIDFVICDTFTPFYNSKRELSNIPNARELCLRNSGLIDWKYCEECKED